MNWKRFLTYSLRWQLGGIIIAPILWVLLEYLEWDYIISMIIMQLLGAIIFYPIDMWIAKQKESLNKKEMNNFKEVYEVKELKSNKLVTILSLPMEESIMFPISQMIDLMKRGEDILYFSFTHDSIKINDFLVPTIKGEPNPENITGGISIYDASQIPKGMDWLKFVEDTITNTQKALRVEGRELNFVFMDLFPFVTNHDVRPATEELVASAFFLMAFTKKITPILIKTIDIPKWTAVQNPEQSKKIMDEFMKKDTSKEMLKQSMDLVSQSDFIISINRSGDGSDGFLKKLLKKLLNFLWFWRKKNNFTLKVLKNRNGGEKSYRVNLDMETFKTEVL